ncbi:MAG: heme-binding protein [Planctomycetota bacterium]
MAQSLGAWSEAGNLLQEALANSEKDDSARPLLKAIAAANRLLSFEPLNEAPMPDGFPATTPAGEIQLKDYPAYRLARTKMGRTDMGAFLTLFRHIKQNDIAMTAPVEMTYPRRTDENEVIGETTMAFLYGSDVGKDTQAEEGVDIVEVAPLQVVSIGNIGRRTNSRVVWAKNRLEAWLAEVRPDLEIVGGLRVLGYNGPSVPTSKQYFEVQFEVRPSTIRGSF